MIALAALLFIRPAEEKKVIGVVSKTDPHFLAVENVVVAIAAGSRSRADDVRSRARLSQSIGRQLFAFCLRNQVFLFLLFSSPRVKRQRIQTGVHRHCDAQKRVDGFELFTNKTERKVVESRAA